MGNYIKIEDYSYIMPKRPQNSNKATFGKVLNIAGSKNYIGAAYLSSMAALRIGCGYVKLACPKNVVNIIASQTPNITFLPLEETQNGTIAQNSIDISSYNVISIGCGLTTNDETALFVQNILNEIQDIPTVIDADGLNIISKLNIEKLPQNTILTPHPLEMSRLLKVDIDEIMQNREEMAVRCARKYQAVVIFKGQKTVVTDGKSVYINQTGNSALAKAGSGDVLTGIISGLLAQKLEPLEATIKAVYLHGLTGECASEQLSEYSVFASDLIDFLPIAIKKII